MRRKESLGRCVAAFGLALAVLALPTVSTAQLGGQLPGPIGGLLPGSPPSSGYHNDSRRYGNPRRHERRTGCNRHCR